MTFPVTFPGKMTMLMRRKNIFIRGGNAHKIIQSKRIRWKFLEPRFYWLEFSTVSTVMGKDRGIFWITYPVS